MAAGLAAWSKSAVREIGLYIPRGAIDFLSSVVYNADIMVMISIARDGKSFGNFSEAAVREGLRSGRYLPTDLGWREGMATWQPLSQFAEFAADMPAGTPPPGAPTPGAPTTSPIVAPGMIAQDSARTGLPWEHRSGRGLLNAFFETLVMVLTKPTAAFTAMSREGGLSEPLIYAVIGGSIGLIASLLFNLAFQSFGLLADRSNALTGMIGAGFGLVFCIILMPVFVAIAMFVGAGILHLCLMIVGGAKQPFETTFRVLCFAMGSTYPLMIVPICGGFIAGVWGIVTECIGLAQAHETDTGRAVLAVFLPLIVCCGGGVLVAFMFGFLGALSQHAH